MTALQPRLAGLALAVLAAGCAPPRAGVSPTPPPAPTPTPSAPVMPLIAVLDHPFGASPNTLRLLRPDGIEVAHASLDPNAEAVAVAGSRLLVAGGGRLAQVGRDGVVTPLGPLAGDSSDQIVRGLAAEPGGRRWLWASVSQSPDGTASSTVYMGSASGAVDVMARDQRSGRALQPVAWTAGGAVLADEPLGIGGYVLFRRSFGATSRLDPATRALRPLAGADCAFSDLAADGSVACVVDGREGPHGDGPVTLRVLRPGRPAVNVALARDVNQAGAAYFKPGNPALLSLAVSPALGTGEEKVETDLVDVPGGTLHRFGPAGIMPAGWLPDGSLLAVRPPGVAGGDPGTYVVAPDGSAALISPASTVLGILD